MRFFIKIASLHILEIPTFQTRPEGSTSKIFKQFGVSLLPFFLLGVTRFESSNKSKIISDPNLNSNYVIVSNRIKYAVIKWIYFGRTFECVIQN